MTAAAAAAGPARARRAVALVAVGGVAAALDVLAHLRERLGR